MDDGMNNDLLTEILCRAPVKSLCMFQCVSKAWCRLISSREFMEVYRARAQPIIIDVGAGGGSHVNSGAGGRPDLRLIDQEGNVLRVFKGLGGDTTICTSMDDLICVYVAEPARLGVHVVDPATGSVLMRCSSVEIKRHRVEPFIRVHRYRTFGFGRAAASGAYKVIRLHVDGRTCEVLTIGDDDTTDGWRQTDSVPTDVPEPKRPPVAINGVLHFWASDDPSRIGLLCFDLESEQWKKKMIQGPDGGKVADSRMVSITELNGALCMVVNVMEPYKYKQIWLLVDSDKSIWRNMYTIPENLCAPLRILFLPDGDKILLHSKIQHEGRLIQLDLRIYDTRTTVCTDIGEMPRGLTGLCSSASLLSTKV